METSSTPIMSRMRVTGIRPVPLSGVYTTFRPLHGSSIMLWPFTAIRNSSITLSGIQEMRPFFMPSSKDMCFTPSKISVAAISAETSFAISAVIWQPSLP